MEKSIVENEKAQMEILDKESKALLRKQPKKKKTRSTTKWNEQAATEIETASVKEVIQAEMSQLSVRASKGGPLTSKEGAGPAQRQSRTKMKRPPKKSRDVSIGYRFARKMHLQYVFKIVSNLGTLFPWFHFAASLFVYVLLFFRHLHSISRLSKRPLIQDNDPPEIHRRFIILLLVHHLKHANKLDLLVNRHRMLSPKA